MTVTPLTGEPDAGNRPVRFGGRGRVSLFPYPYIIHTPINSSLRQLRERMDETRGMSWEFSPAPLQSCHCQYVALACAGVWK